MPQPIPRRGREKLKTSVTVRADYLKQLKREGRRQQRSVSFLLESIIESRVRQINRRPTLTT